jgi:hypothetical protein
MGIDNLEHKHLQELGRIINAKIEDWFGIKITPLKFNHEDSPDSGFTSESLSDLGLSPLFSDSEYGDISILGDSSQPSSTDA